MFSDAERPLYELKANLFKGLSHPFRVRVLELLASHDERSVAQLLADTGLEASHLSQHLGVLRKHHLVTSERRASQVFYRLTHPQVADFLSVSKSLLEEMLRSTQKQLDQVAGSPR